MLCVSSGVKEQTRHFVSPLAVKMACTHLGLKSLRDNMAMMTEMMNDGTDATGVLNAKPASASFYDLR